MMPFGLTPGGGGIAGKAGTGAAIGSIVPGIGTGAGAILGAGIGILGSIFGNKAKNKKAKAAYEMQRPQMERSALHEATRNSLFAGLARAYGIEGGLPTGALEKLRTPVAVPQYSGAGEGWEMFGDALGAGVAGAQAGGNKDPVDYTLLEELLRQELGGRR
jgi:hypothetical protein